MWYPAGSGQRVGKRVVNRQFEMGEHPAARSNVQVGIGVVEQRHGLRERPNERGEPDYDRPGGDQPLNPTPSPHAVVWISAIVDGWRGTGLTHPLGIFGLAGRTFLLCLRTPVHHHVAGPHRGTEREMRNQLSGCGGFCGRRARSAMNWSNSALSL